MATTKSNRSDKKTPQPSSPGLVVLQWLTYAFWGWTVLALTWLVSIILTTVISNVDTSDMVAYAIASVVVLLPIAAITDLFYTRYEPVKKTGAVMVVMVIHAVIFAIFGIGALIIGVLSVVQLFLATGDTTATQVATYTAFIVALFYAITFFRTLNPTKSRQLVHGYIGVMVVLIGAFIVLGFTGPLTQASLSRDDRLIEANISFVTDSIRQYSADNNKLPESLGVLDIQNSSAKQLVDRQLVRYQPGEMVDEKSFKYTLCVTYKKSKGEPGSSRPYIEPNGETTSIYTYDHAAGEVCYKLLTASKADDIYK